jgi:cholesterol transport system auxiliary component
MMFLGSTRSVMCWVLSISALGGCALLNKAEPLTPRYFSPAPGTQSSGPRQRDPSVNAPAQRLRLGEVQAATYLEARIAYRVAQSELGYHEDRRWTEDPQDYLRREIGRQLFEQRRVLRVFAGSAPTLDVELTAFEEILGAKPLVRVSASYGLRSDREAVGAGTITVERPLKGGDSDRPREVAVELGAALTAAVSQICDRVLQDLSVTASSPASDARAAAP